MDWIGSALAFAVTMLALSIVVTTTVETIHRIVGLREKGLKLMLGHFYDAEIASYVGTPSAATTREKFVGAMTRNRAPTGHRGAINWIWSGNDLGTLGLDDFMGRLGDSPFGDALAKAALGAASDAIDPVVRDVAHKFEEFGRDASVYFEARARLLSVLVAFVVAWQCYVHPYELFSTFLRNPTITQKVIDGAPQILEQSRKAEERLAAVQRLRREQAGTADAAQGADAVADAEREVKALQTKTRAIVDSMSAAGVPIGWTPERMEEARFASRYLVVYPQDLSSAALTTAAWLILGGLLVGLGGPFWRDLVLSLTRLRGGAAEERQKAEQATPGQTVDRIASAADRFLTASRARAVDVGLVR